MTSIAAAVAMVASGVAISQTPAGSTPSAATPGTAPNAVSDVRQDNGRTTKEFVRAATQAGSEEIAAAQLANSKSQSADVKAFAQKMIADHGKADAQLRQVASKKGFAVPVGPASEDSRMLIQLKEKSGATFDAAYARAMAEDHQKGVTLFQQAAQNPNLDRDVQKYAQSTLPTLQDHLTMANKLVAAHASQPVG
ncbi:MAG TPA: DUF4142 domain-containing protein [Steroidobacteraceae bacterium]|jgi:putative membrane protein|nr:DUF4142 domain-containing protein [Steroidobacteraceae bacterium]